MGAWQAMDRFPALGFDPAPGRVDALATAGSAVDATVARLADTLTALSTVGVAGWTGPAGEAFDTAVGVLPRDLGLARDAWTEAGAALADYRRALAGMQDRARWLEGRAVQARTGDELAELRTLAGRLRAEHAELAAGTAARLDRAAGTVPYREPSGWDAFWAGVGDWVRDNAAGLAELSGIAKGFAGLLGLVGFVFPPAAVAAAVLGAVALAADTALMAATGQGSWGDIAVDAVLTLVPGGTALGVGRRAAALFREGSWAAGRLPTRPMLRDFRGEHLPDAGGPARVRYFDDAEREAHRLEVRGGRLVHSDGRPFDTGDGKGIWVMDGAGRIYGHPLDVAGPVKHSSPRAGGRLAGAGQVRSPGGWVEVVNDVSGHYRFTQPFTARALREMRRQGLNLDDVAVTITSPH